MELWREAQARHKHATLAQLGTTALQELKTIFGTHARLINTVREEQLHNKPAQTILTSLA